MSNLLRKKPACLALDGRLFYELPFGKAALARCELFEGLTHRRSKLRALVPLFRLYVDSKLSHALGGKSVSLTNLSPFGRELIAVNVFRLCLPRAYRRLVLLLLRGLLFA